MLLSKFNSNILLLFSVLFYLFRLLLRAGANINSVDNDGWTPLHAAAHWDKHDVIKYLIERNADLDAKNDAVKKNTKKDFNDLIYLGTNTNGCL
jgi:ankyrin repeat protein